MSDSTGWVILHTRYGEEVRLPSDRELAQAIDELLNEEFKGMIEADYAEHPSA